MGLPKLGRGSARCRVFLGSVSKLLKVHWKLKYSFRNSICEVQALPSSSSTTRCGANGRVMGIAWLERNRTRSGAVFCLHRLSYTDPMSCGNGLDDAEDQLCSCRSESCCRSFSHVADPSLIKAWSGSTFVVFQPDVSPAVRQTHNWSLVTTAAALPQQMLLRFLQKNGQSLIGHRWVTKCLIIEKQPNWLSRQSIVRLLLTLLQVDSRLCRNSLPLLSVNQSLHREAKVTWWWVANLCTFALLFLSFWGQNARNQELVWPGVVSFQVLRRRQNKNSMTPWSPQGLPLLLLALLPRAIWLYLKLPPPRLTPG